jgi:hypothetical protein
MNEELDRRTQASIAASYLGSCGKGKPKHFSANDIERRRASMVKINAKHAFIKKLSTVTLSLKARK